jgi:hypothetical protein
MGEKNNETRNMNSYFFTYTAGIYSSKRFKCRYKPLVCFHSRNEFCDLRRKKMVWAEPNFILCGEALIFALHGWLTGVFA